MGQRRRIRDGRRADWPGRFVQCRRLVLCGQHDKRAVRGIGLLVLSLGGDRLGVHHGIHHSLVEQRRVLVFALYVRTAASVAVVRLVGRERRHRLAAVPLVFVARFGEALDDELRVLYGQPERRMGRLVVFFRVELAFVLPTGRLVFRAVEGRMDCRRRTVRFKRRGNRVGEQRALPCGHPFKLP